MTDLKYVRQDFTEEEITAYARCWNISYEQAEQRLAALTIDQTC